MTDTISRSPLTTAHRGDVHRQSRVFIPTTREAPADATSAGHQFLIRGGFIRQVGAGVYNYLPLAWRSIEKISSIIKEEMNAAGSIELRLPAMAPLELYDATGRAEDYGDTLFRFTDRHGRDSILAPTHEEIITTALKGAVNSYKQLPLSLFQIQTKFRDEFRPRSALLRGREFIMKDAYTFHATKEGPGGLDEGYQEMYDAYVRIFERLGLPFSAVEAESGPIGGSFSHEFMINADSGEDTILVDRSTGYAANVEKCPLPDRASNLDGTPKADLTKQHTPNMPGIDGVAQHLGVNASGMLKCILFQPKNENDQFDWVLAIVRGDHEVNEFKVRDAVGFAVQLGDDKLARGQGFAIGYVSPRAAIDNDRVRVVIDPDAAQPEPSDKAWATGADEPDHHVTGFNWQREAGGLLGSGRCSVADIRNAMAGDKSPKSDAKLETQRGVECGHIFQLGTKYSEALELVFMDENQKRAPVIMGCYGIGVTRVFQACLEMSHDDNGAVWTPATAPYHVHIVAIKHEDEAVAEACAKLADELSGRGIDVLIDDRKERPGPKFKDADLIGMPVRLTVGAKTLEQGSAEFKLRTDGGKGDLVPLDQAAGRCVDAILNWS